MLDELPPVGFDDSGTYQSENRIIVKWELTQKICEMTHLDNCPVSFPGIVLEDDSVIVGLVKFGIVQQEPELYKIFIKDDKIVDWSLESRN